MPTSDLRALIRQQYGSTLARLNDRVRGDVTATSTQRRDRSDIPALLVLPSVVDSVVEVHVSVVSIPVCSFLGFIGTYTPGSHVVAVSVHGRCTRTGRPIELAPAEADAWGTVLAPIGYEEYVVRLGVLTGPSCRAVHYRFVVGPDSNLHILDPHDHVTLARTYRHH
jgi:hypothetical protein